VVKGEVAKRRSPVSMSLTLGDAHAPIVALGIYRPDVGGQAPAVVSLVVEVPAIVETLETTRRRHVDLDLMDRKPRVLGAIGRIGGI
jgi:hypothetical protein